MEREIKVLYKLIEEGIFEKMREIKLILNKRIDIKKLIVDRFNEMNLSEYYLREFKSEKAKVYFFVYEWSYSTFKQVSFFSRRPGEIIVSTSILAKVEEQSTKVSLVLSTDDADDIPNSMLVYITSHGFSIYK